MELGVIVQLNTKRRDGRSYRVDPTTGCWEVFSCIQPNGYAKMWDGKQTGWAHRVMYGEICGPIPDGMDLDHLCRNRKCVNPKHLEVVSRAENIRRGEGTRLSVDIVTQIRADYQPGVFGYRRLAVKYSVSRTNIRNIINNKTWKLEVA